MAKVDKEMVQKIQTLRNCGLDLVHRGLSLESRLLDGLTMKEAQELSRAIIDIVDTPLTQLKEPQ